MNSLHSTRIFNRKAAANSKDARNHETLNSGRLIGEKSEFNKLRATNIIGSKRMSMPTSPENDVKTSSRGTKLVESHNYISQPENEFYRNSKIFYKPDLSSAKY